MLCVEEPATPNIFKKYVWNDYKPLKNDIQIFIKYEYLGRDGDPAEEVYNIETKEETTIKQIKEELNKKFIFGELDPDQYEIYKGGLQENKNKEREAQTQHFIYLEPELLDNNNKTLKDYNIKDDELLYLKVKLRINLYVPCCRFTTIFLYTDGTLKDIQKEAIKTYNINMGLSFKEQRIKAFYGDTEIIEEEELSTYNIYNNSTITTEIYNNRY